MSEGRVWRRGSAILALSLLVMILMRLVWVQARHYEPLGMGQYNLATALAPEGCALLDPQEGKGTRPALERSSTGTGFWMTKDAARHLWVRFSCRNHVFRADLAARNNQALLFGTVFAAVLFTRIASSSWLLALIAGTVILSRGRLIAAVGETSWDWLFVLFFTFWAANVAHYLKTGARLSLVGLYLLAAILVGLHPAFWGLVWAMPLMLLVGLSVRTMARARAFDAWRAFRLRHPWHYERSHTSIGRAFVRPFIQTSGGRPGHAQRLSAAQPRIFLNLGRPYCSWMTDEDLWRRKILVHCLGALLVVAVALWARGFWREPWVGLGSLRGLSDWAFAWFGAASSLLDLDLKTTVAVLVCCLFTSLLWCRDAIWEIIVVCCLAILLILAGAMLSDFVGLGRGGDHVSLMIAPRLLASQALHALLWCEPILLCLGLVGIRHLVRSASLLLGLIPR